MNFTEVPLWIKLLCYLCVGFVYSFAEEVTEAFLPRQCGIASILPSVRLNKWGCHIFSENNSLVVCSATSNLNLFIIWLLDLLIPDVHFVMQIQRLGSSF